MEKFNELKDLVTTAAAAVAAERQSNGADVKPDNSQQQMVSQPALHYNQCP